MKSLRSSLLPLLVTISFCALMTGSLLCRPSTVKSDTTRIFYNEDALWQAPDTNAIATDSTGDLVRYGKELITNTAYYLGPKGIVTSISNGMNCQNCHLAAGTKNFSNPFSAVASTYPKYRDRSGRLESIEFRVNECLQRSLNGGTLDSLSYEMRAFVAYLTWIGEGVPKDHKPKGNGTYKLAYLDRAADAQKGKAIFTQYCSRCHGEDGGGVPSAVNNGYTYPPLWGDASFNVSAGMYRLSTLAGFIYTSMPFDKPSPEPVLTEEQAWDVAAYVISGKRPDKRFAYDWPDISKKPVDHPFGPYADSFPQSQHQYGPYLPMVNKKPGKR